MKEKAQEAINKLYDQAKYYEDHPMYPAYGMNAIATTYRQAMIIVAEVFDIPVSELPKKEE